MNPKRSFKSIVLIPLFVLAILFNSIAYGAPGVQHRLMDETVRLEALAKVWGLLKYYHPEVAKGEMDWDAALMSAVPAVRAAEDYTSFNQEINNLIVQAGDVDISDYNPGTPATPDTEKMFKWVKDNHVFSRDVRKKLETMRKKHIPADNFYVQPGRVGEANFDNELPYFGTNYPDENMRFLAVARYWNAIHYFYPYKHMMDVHWDNALPRFIPRALEAATDTEYHLVIREMSVLINDSHSFMYSYPLARYWGFFYAPFEVRHIEGKTIVSRVFASLMTPAGSVQVGDIILECHGMAIDKYRTKIKKYVEGSNEVTIQRNINAYVVRGSDGQFPFKVLRNGQTLDVQVQGCTRSAVRNLKNAEDQAQEKWKILPGNIGYVNMGIMDFPATWEIMVELHNTEAIIFDIRNYPQFILYVLHYWLTPEPQAFAQFHRPDFGTPGTYVIEEQDVSEWGWDSNEDYYRGKVILLIDEETQSLAEFTCMGLKPAPDTTIIGSQTAGTDGDITGLILPGGIQTYITGIGMYYADGTPTQRIGIVPDIHIRPTVTGIQQGRDEVLERALQFIETGQ